MRVRRTPVFQAGTFLYLRIENNTLMEDKRDEQTEEEEPPIEKRFPAMPPLPNLPEVPKYDAKLPDINAPRRGTVEPGAYGKMAVAVTAATSFVMPVIVMGGGGWLLDQKLKHETAWFALVGVVVGFFVGVVALLRVIQKLQD